MSPVREMIYHAGSGKDQSLARRSTGDPPDLAILFPDALEIVEQERRNAEMAPEFGASRRLVPGA